MTRLGVLLWLRRQATGKSIVDVARHMGVTISKAREWEGGNDDPTRAETRKLARLYGCSEEQLFGSELIPEREAWKVLDILSAGELPRDL